jgi:hypothetical protein
MRAALRRLFLGTLRHYFEIVRDESRAGAVASCIRLMWVFARLPVPPE